MANSLDRKRAYYLQQIGIDLWVSRTNALPISLIRLSQQVAQCTRCPLHQTRTQTVFARGNANAHLMVIGEAPGFHEDKQGKPFVGKAGALLNQMLNAIGLTEEHIYIANVLKCRPPDNRSPLPDEINQCGDYLVQQIKAVNPKLILAVGRFAGQFLLKKTLSITNMRGKVHVYNDTPVIVSYHPAYLLRNPLHKKHAYQDLLHVQSLCKI